MDARAKAEEFFEIMSARRKTLIEIPMNCSQGETGVLRYLTFVQDGVTASELSEKLEVSLPRIASVLNSLELKELIVKNTDNEDKRKTSISITEKGKKLVLNKKEEAINKVAEIIEKLGEEDINEYIRLTKKIGKIIDDM